MRYDSVRAENPVRVGHPACGLRQEAFKPCDVVFGIALKAGADLSPDSLFTSSQISLLHAGRALQSLNIKVRIQGIDYRARSAEECAAKESNGGSTA